MIFQNAAKSVTAARRRLAAAVPRATFGPGSHGSPRLPRVLFVNDLWGYGTVTMAMAVAERLEGQVVSVFAGMGPGFELARRAPFDCLVAADTMASPTP